MCSMAKTNADTGRAMYHLSAGSVLFNSVLQDALGQHLLHQNEEPVIPAVLDVQIGAEEGPRGNGCGKLLEHQPCCHEKGDDPRRKQQAGQKRPPGGHLLHLQSEPRLDKSGSPGEEQGAEQQDALRDAGADLTGDVREHGGDHLQDDLDDGHSGDQHKVEDPCVMGLHWFCVI